MKDIFRKKREEVGLRQEDVAEKLGLDQSAISMWETGASLPRTKLLPKIAILYGCTVDDLINSEPLIEGNASE